LQKNWSTSPKPVQKTVTLEDQVNLKQSCLFMRLIQVCLSSDYDGQTQQAEMLIRSLAEKKIKQLLVCRKNSALHNRLSHLRNLPLVTVSSIWSGHFKVPRTGLVHAHDITAAKWARLQNFLRGTPWLMSWYFPDEASVTVLKKSLLKNAQALLVNSIPVEQAMREKAYCAVKRLPSAVFPLETNPMAMTQLRSHYQGRFVIGHSGKISGSGNQKLLLEAAELLQKDLPNVVFILLGDGPLKNKLKKASEGLKNIDFVGEPKHPGDYFSIMNIYVDPANRAESFTGLLHAMNFHIPVVTSRVSGFTEFIRHRSNGLLFKKNDVDSLIEMIRVLYDSVPLRTRITRDAHNQLKDVTPEKVSHKNLAVYSALIQNLKAKKG